MWEDMRLTGDDGWLEEAIRENLIVAVTDGSYMQDKFPTKNSCAFILECTKGHGRLTGAFPEQTIAACSYCGELIGLLAIHLLLLSFSRVAPELTGSVHIYLDCLGALDKVKNLPPHHIPSKCRHSDVLKNIMVHCSGSSFTKLFSHVSAHQDNRTNFEDLSRPAQLNCAVDFGAKKGSPQAGRTQPASPTTFPTRGNHCVCRPREDDFGHRTVSTIFCSSPIGKRGILSGMDSLLHTVQPG
jgi:hypothetical protein